MTDNTTYFDISNPNTWNTEVPTASLKLNGKSVYRYEKDGSFSEISAKDFVDFMNCIFNFLGKRKPMTSESKKHAVNVMFKRLYENCTDIKKMKNNSNHSISESINTDFFNRLSPDLQKELNDMDSFEKDLEDDSKIVKSNESYSGYILTLAQSEMLKELSIFDKEKICKVTRNNIENHLDKSRLRQELFDSSCKCDNYLFSDLAYCISIKQENEIMFSYFTGFEKLKDIDLHCSYLSKYPDLCKNIIDSFTHTTDNYTVVRKGHTVIFKNKEK